ncbi:MAG: UDP-3-O-(3-hydroxymyristoyl)glucosamine N-acyltransferase [Planctomycetota bacterium]
MTQLHELSQLVGGNLTSQPDRTITGAASIARATSTEITFANSAKHFQQFLNSDAAAAVIPLALEPLWESASSEQQDGAAKPCIMVDDVDDSFIQIATQFKPPIDRAKIGISPQAIVSPTAKIADGVCVHAGAVIMDDVEIGPGSVIFPNVTVMENAIIGSHVKIYPGATIYEKTVIGDRAIIHAGAVLGAFGFGYKSATGMHLLSAQLGNVVVGDDVEIGANTTIDRGTYDATTIGTGTKLDNMVMVGHNCVIGQHNLLCSQVGIAGSCETGDYVVMGGQVGLADHLTIGSQVSIGAKSGLMHDVESGQKYFGIPARPAREEMRIVANRAKLPEMRKQLKEMQKSIADLTAKIEAGTVKTNAEVEPTDSAESQAA